MISIAYMQVESAKKLRWYDRDDLSQLVKANVKEKRDLQFTIQALQQVLIQQQTTSKLKAHQICAMQDLHIAYEHKLDCMII